MAAGRGDVDTRDAHRLFTARPSWRKAHSVPLPHDHPLVSGKTTAIFSSAPFPVKQREQSTESLGIGKLQRKEETCRMRKSGSAKSGGSAKSSMTSKAAARIQSAGA